MKITQEMVRQAACDPDHWVIRAFKRRYPEGFLVTRKNLLAEAARRRTLIRDCSILVVSLWGWEAHTVWMAHHDALYLAWHEDHPDRWWPSSAQHRSYALAFRETYKKYGRGKRCQ